VEASLIVSSLLLWMIVIFNLFLTLALVRRLNNVRPREKLDPGLSAGEIAPDFTAQTLSGETVTRSMYAGRRVAFVFISAHCVPCHDLVLQLESLTSQAAQAGVEVVLVSSDKQEETRAFIEQKKIHLPVLVAPHEANAFFADYRSPGTPAYCFVNADGKVHSAGIPLVIGTVWREFDDWIKQEVPVA
jgi:peroxiredoxin